MNFCIDVLKEGEHLELLGTVVSLEDVTGAEIENRVVAGWRKFWDLKRLLLNKSYSLRKRLKLFDATVTETVLWAAELWTPRTEELRRFKATHSATLRRIVGCGRLGRRAMGGLGST